MRPPGEVWLSLVPVKAYPADDTCFINNLIPGNSMHGPAEDPSLGPYRARTSAKVVEFCVVPGDYYVLALQAGQGWWGSRSVRRKVTVAGNTEVSLTSAEINHENCTD